MALSRLSPYNIADDLIRNELYREIRAASTDWTTYIIEPDETLRPDLAAYRAYGTDECKWVIMIAAKLDDPRDEMTAGTELRLPTHAWLRERIKYYQSLEGS